MDASTMFVKPEWMTSNPFESNICSNKKEKKAVDSTNSSTTSISEGCDETKLQSPDEEEQKTQKEIKRIYIYNEEIKKKIAINMHGNNSIKSILSSLFIKSSKYRLINFKTKRELKNDTKLSDYPDIENESILILKKKTKEKEILFLHCNFGFPFQNKILKVTYHKNLTLKDYQIKVLKKQFNISNPFEIKFYQKKKSTKCLEKLITNQFLKNLNIEKNDKIYAILSPINIEIISVFSHKKIKFTMFKYFNLKMLKNQIKKIFSIPTKHQNLICNAKYIKNEKKLNEIKETLNNQSMTIYVIEKCRCDHSKKTDIDRPQQQQQPNVCMNTNNPPPAEQPEPHHFIHYNHRNNVPYYFQPRPRTRYVYRKKTMFDDEDNHNIHDPWYSNLRLKFNDEDGPKRNDMHNEFNMELMNFLVADGSANHHTFGSKNDDKLKICRYGIDCRYNNNPHISGPCRYYHPLNNILNQQKSNLPPWKTTLGSLHYGIKKNKYHTNYTLR